MTGGQKLHEMSGRMKRKQEAYRKKPRDLIRRAATERSAANFLITSL